MLFVGIDAYPNLLIFSCLSSNSLRYTSCIDGLRCKMASMNSIRILSKDAEYLFSSIGVIVFVFSSQFTDGELNSFRYVLKVSVVSIFVVLFTVILLIIVAYVVSSVGLYQCLMIIFYGFICILKSLLNVLFFSLCECL